MVNNTPQCRVQQHGMCLAMILGERMPSPGFSRCVSKAWQPECLPPSQRCVHWHARGDNKRCQLWWNRFSMTSWHRECASRFSIWSHRPPNELRSCHWRRERAPRPSRRRHWCSEWKAGWSVCTLWISLRVICGKLEFQWLQMISHDRSSCWAPLFTSFPQLISLEAIREKETWWNDESW